MNSAAALKAFCGRNGGIVCTSSNAGRVFDWAFERGEKILFFPDEHLGRNTGVKKGIPLDKMVVWDPFQPLGGNTPEALRDATVILWKGYCSVHARFSVEQIEQARAELPRTSTSSSTRSAGWRSCRPPTATARPSSSSTRSRRRRPARPGPSAPRSTSSTGSTPSCPDKHVFCLDPVICPCSTMYRVHPAYVLWTLEHLAAGEVVNQITVDPETTRDALVALDRMLAVP